MITIVTGTLGGGKSYYCLRRMVETLQNGKCVATNTRLVPDYATRIASRWNIGRLRHGVEDRAADIERRYFYAESLDELRRVKLEGRGEKRGLMVIDEGQGFLNSRMWAKGDRADNIKFFTHARKLGWEVLLISQDAGNIDKQVRVLCQYETRVKNLRRVKVAGVPIVPVNLFLAITKLENEKHKPIVKRNCYGLNWCKNLYDTFEIHTTDDETDTTPSVILPRPAAPPQGGTPGAAQDSVALYPVRPGGVPVGAEEAKGWSTKWAVNKNRY